MQSKFERIGHRGAPKLFPGNTMRGFEKARELGCTMVECDIRRAADGVLVLAHDPHVRAADGREYAIENHTSAELAALDLGAGEGVPTLAQLVAWALGRCRIMADMKCELGDVEAGVVEALRPLPNAEKIVPGAGRESRARFREIDPTLPLSLSLGGGPNTMNDAQFAELLPTIDTDAVTWQYPLLNAERVFALHARNLRVFAWTVDDPAEIDRMVACHVDGIISNRADILPFP